MPLKLFLSLSPGTCHVPVAISRSHISWQTVIFDADISHMVTPSFISHFISFWIPPQSCGPWLLAIFIPFSNGVVLDVNDADVYACICIPPWNRLANSFYLVEWNWYCMNSFNIHFIQLENINSIQSDFHPKIWTQVSNYFLKISNVMIRSWHFKLDTFKIMILISLTFKMMGASQSSPPQWIAALYLVWFRPKGSSHFWHISELPFMSHHAFQIYLQKPPGKHSLP